MSAGGCCQTLLSQGSCTQLSRCSCGHLHLALGPVTVRLEEGALRELWSVLRGGLEALGEPAHALEAPPARRGGWRQ